MKPECKLTGKNGNVFNLIAIVRRTLLEHNLDEELIRQVLLCTALPSSKPLHRNSTTTP
jgi:hypothetical protein